MSQRVKIFVEGIADKTFLRQYVNNTFNIQLTCDDVITTGGWQDIKSNTIMNQLKKNTDSFLRILLIKKIQRNKSKCPGSHDSHQAQVSTM